MDTKNDDSAGSDSLDKSLQKKCVVDDVGQGECATTATAAPSSNSNCSDNSEKKTVTTDTAKERKVTTAKDNSSKKQKTEKNVGDTAGRGGGEADAFANDTTTSLAQQATAEMSPAAENTIPEDEKTQISNIDAPASALSTSSLSTSTSTAETPTASSKNTSNSNAFETKVKQISKNLQETTLAESAQATVTLEDCSSTSSASSASSDNDDDDGDANDLVLTPSSSSTSTSSNSTSSRSTGGELDWNGPPMLYSTSGATCAATDSSSTEDHRSKKVRFHPDVKENDGGNRIISKRRKKHRTSPGSGQDDEAGPSGSSGSSHRTAVDEMELEEEEDAEEEEEEDDEEFDLAKTIAEAQDYLETHPLTFQRSSTTASSYDKTKPPPAVASTSQGLRRRLLVEDEPQQLSESSDEETDDFYKGVPSENGVERIVGKQIRGGRVEFLLRYADRPGLHWATEEVLSKECPSLLDKYEENRERSQDRLMRHIAKRQNLRQRYTDF